MTQHERGAYTPQPDAPLAFDARAPRGARRPLPMALIGSAAVLLVLIVAVVMYYRSGVRSPAGEAKPVGQPVETLKTPAPANANDDPFSNLDGPVAQNVPAAGTTPTFAPPPEQPQARPAPAPTPTPAPGGLKVQTVEASALHAVPAAPAPVAAAAPAAPAHDAATAAAKPVAPAATPKLAAPVAVAAATPAKKAPPIIAAPPPAAKPAAPTAAAPAGPSVQIGAYSSTALADKGFAQVASGFPKFMGGKTKHIEALERDGKTLYRTTVHGFATKADAQALCDALKAAGRVCLVKG